MPSRPPSARPPARGAPTRRLAPRTALSASPSWLPEPEQLKALADGEKPLTFFCLRREDWERKAICCCEVKTEATERREYHFRVGDDAGSLRRCSVNEIPFSEGKLGGHVWDGGVLMAAWALSRAGDAGLEAGGLELFEGRRVLELGSGLGLVGMALASGASASVVLTDFGSEGSLDADPDRLIPVGLLGNLRANVRRNGLGDAAEVEHLDWHDFLERPGRPARQPLERFDRLVGADVVYYASDLPALAAAVAAHLAPGGRGFFLVPGRDWTGPLAGERATCADLLKALQPHGEVCETLLVGHCGSVEGDPVRLVELKRGGS